MLVVKKGDKLKKVGPLHVDKQASFIMYLISSASCYTNILYKKAAASIFPGSGSMYWSD